MIQKKFFVCFSRNLFSVLNFGKQPIVNQYINKKNKPGKLYPLSLKACKICGHGQQGFFVRPEIIFNNYIYASGTSNTLKKYFSWLASQIKNNSKKNELLLEIGSNDGSFLLQLKKKGLDGTGIDPATKMVKLAKNKGIHAIDGYWPDSFKNNQKLRKLKKYKFVLAQNVLAHTPDPYNFIYELRKVLNREGFLIIQTSQAEMLSKGQFDTIYHEHYSFFSEKSIIKLLDRTGFEVTNQILVNIHGVSLLTVARFKNSHKKKFIIENKNFFIKNILKNKYQDESYSSNISKYKKFKELVKSNIYETKKIIKNYKNKNYLIVFVGAAAKALTYMYISNIKPNLIIDESKFKIGKKEPKGRYVINSLHALVKLKKPVLCVITAWNFFDELKKKIKLLRKNNHNKTLYYKYFPRQKLL
jgi:2-polyprenyl-3-methyl-5-hydroxy-6-metoxy-1,4-benzoquinol methylase